MTIPANPPARADASTLSSEHPVVSSARSTGSADCVRPDHAGARWAYAAGATGTAANALLIGFFALMPVAGQGNPLGPANDLVGSLGTALMIPAAIAIGRCLPRGRRVRLLQRAALTAMGGATLAGPLLVSGAVPFPVTTTVSVAAFGVIVGWVGSASRSLERGAGLPRRTSRLGRVSAWAAWAGAGLAGLSFLLPAGSAGQLGAFGAAAVAGGSSFVAVPVWFALVGRWLDRPGQSPAPEGRPVMSSIGGPAAREMPVIHRIFRRQFAEVRALVPEVPAGDVTRVTAVADHLTFLLDGLHMHHTTEDDLIWPKLLDRARLDAPLVERMEEQHQHIDASVGEVRVALAAWRSDPTSPTAVALADRLGEFLVVLVGHLDEEEQVVVPLIDRELTESEWQEVGKRGFEKFTPAQRWIATGLLVEVATPEEVAMMFDTMPPPVKVLWRLVGRRKYRRYITPVRAGSSREGD